jgi:2-C-methyl-D-erythritol 2,4-cyclodiphosphate synthase
LLGAAGFKDIGHQFPDSDPEFRNIDSKILLKKTFELINKKGFSVVNIDSTICLERPKIADYAEEMKRTISGILETSPENISIKATTAEKLGFIGREEGIMALAAVLIR